MQCDRAPFRVFYPPPRTVWDVSRKNDESEPDADWQGRTGFVHAAVLQDLPDLSAHEVYACGNPLMIDAARAAFTAQAGLPAAHFYCDAFVINTA